MIGIIDEGKRKLRQDCAQLSGFDERSQRGGEAAGKAQILCLQWTLMRQTHDAP